MGGSETDKQSDTATGENEDPLAGLYQIDAGDGAPLEGEALVLMARMLDDVEEFDELSGGLRRIMEEDVLVETRILSLFKALLHGVAVEHKYLKMGFMS